MNFELITLFPEMFKALDYGIVGRALEQRLINIGLHNPRDFAKDKHRTVDDRPYGGGPGMLMKVQPLRDAIHAAKQSVGKDAKVIYLSPQGKPLTQMALSKLSHYPKMILVAGRYEGIDQRCIDLEIDEEWSIGDYVLSGGELAAMVLIDALTRLLPGALGHEESARQESFMENLLDYPHYTRPEVIASKSVPEVLLSGDHQAIAKWRLQQALGMTWLKRPDLLAKRELSREELELLEQFKLTVTDSDSAD